MLQSNAQVALCQRLPLGASNKCCPLENHDVVSLATLPFLILRAQVHSIAGLSQKGYWLLYGKY